MRRNFLWAGAAALLIFGATGAQATERYGQRPPVVVSPDLSAPWVMQLGRTSQRQKQRKYRERSAPVAVMAQPSLREVRRVYRQPAPSSFQTVGARAPARREIQPQISPMYLPQTVAYNSGEKPGTIVIDTTQNFLYHVQAGGKARRYGVGTGKPGFEWAGTHKVTQKRQWPDWRPPAEMIARERAKGRILPAHMEGGPENPLGARALYLGSTLYRIHGTNQPWTIGGAVSSGCIRMRNEDVSELYNMVKVGTKVIVR
ncbi:L,D-transpeptidase family protein [Mesorhizobium sp. NBSH29]|uniref:L,D-transpeptidase n=1 Tax=Mesorhizobium sp. NBSH29 TaxID=2654249 RepID=UPI0018969F3D|nr:L,D-transpeptidase [Mesorhizobium sp. NBSH29]QPC86835.1 L,D-transpeptidase family protein [Mesorhizobium sp. NBSH29]